jgi:hypothetical protein
MSNRPDLIKAKREYLLDGKILVTVDEEGWPIRFSLTEKYSFCSPPTAQDVRAAFINRYGPEIVDYGNDPAGPTGPVLDVAMSTTDEHRSDGLSPPWMRGLGT